MIQRTGKYYWLTVICFVVFSIGVMPIVLFTGWASDSLCGVWLGTAICGLGNGIGGTTTLVGLSKTLLARSSGWLTLLQYPTLGAMTKQLV